MVISCIAFGCTNRQNQKRGAEDVTKEEDTRLQFHRFPFKRPEILCQWVTAVRRKNWSPTKYSFLCSKHFTPDDYQHRPGAECRWLKETAVPTVFPAFPEHLKLKPKQPRRLLKRRATQTAEYQPMMELEQMNIELETMSQEVTQKDTTSTRCTTAKSASPTKIHLRRKVKILQQRLKRRDIKLKNMASLLKILKTKIKSPDEVIEVLKHNFSGFPLELLMHTLKTQKKKSFGIMYTTLMKEFSLTLYFYSPKSYRYVRTLFHLPHPSRIRAWVSKVNCEPGFIQEAFQYLKANVNETSYLKDCAIIIDSMAIRKQTIWDDKNKRYAGYVDCGGIADSNSDIAREVLVIMMVSLAGSFKCPLGYFFVNKVSSAIQGQLLDVAITKLKEVGVHVYSITFDGCQANIKSMEELGCNMNINDKKFTPNFYHKKTSQTIHAILDPCHMVKLARNTLADMDLTSSNGVISWRYIAKLHEIQCELGLKFANKLSGMHVRFKNKIMNVKLAVQVLSSGVADAIDYLRQQGDQNFQGSEATTEFIRIIDKAFDILNVRSPHGKGFKRPLTLKSKEEWENVFSETTAYLKGLNIAGVSILNHNRKTFAVGLIIAMQSVRSVNNLLLCRKAAPLKYVLTYKYSQDHVELFFSAIRAKGGCNNNPNCLQFKSAVRCLLLQNSIGVGIVAGNCLNRDLSGQETIFEFRDERRTIIDTLNVDNREEEENEIKEYCKMLDRVSMNDYIANILYYISGYIVRRILKVLTCEHCTRMIQQDRIHIDHSYGIAPKNAHSHQSFTFGISRGGLINASESVFTVVKTCEKVFRTTILSNSALMKRKMLDKFIVNILKNYFHEKGIRLFVEFNHPVDVEVGENLHEQQLVNKIAEMYTHLRLQTYGKIYTQSILLKNSTSVRSRLNKFILFNNV